MAKYISTLVLFLFCFLSSAQTTNKSFVVKQINATIEPDGILDETYWETADSANEFWEYFPLDSIQARKQTEIKMLYDDDNLYIGITVYTAGKERSQRVPALSTRLNAL